MDTKLWMCILQGILLVLLGFLLFIAPLILSFMISIWFLLLYIISVGAVIGICMYCDDV